MAVDKRWLDFMREQYPVGSRIVLRELKDPYSKLEPGLTGELQGIDDIGTFHVNWDNGSTLGLVIGEDRFSVLPPELKTLKLYMPMTVDYYERDSWGDMESEPTELSDFEAVKYVDNINAALQRYIHPHENQRGLMTYYGYEDGVNKKVLSYVFKAEVKNGRLWGVAECKVLGELTREELERLKSEVSGQASDGFGEGFEQQEIKTPDGVNLYAHLWQWDGWSIQTEQELFGPKLAEGLPDLCFSVIPDTGKLICIKRGESGYYPSGWNTDDKEKNLELADYNNERLGVTKEQRLAMECGSMYGWHVPGADPAAYETRMGGMTLQ